MPARAQRAAGAARRQGRQGRTAGLAIIVRASSSITQLHAAAGGAGGLGAALHAGRAGPGRAGHTRRSTSPLPARTVRGAIRGAHGAQRGIVVGVEQQRLLGRGGGVSRRDAQHLCGGRARWPWVAAVGGGDGPAKEHNPAQPSAPAANNAHKHTASSCCQRCREYSDCRTCNSSPRWSGCGTRLQSQS